jgi:hypothetical protein
MDLIAFPAKILGVILILLLLLVAGTLLVMGVIRMRSNSSDGKVRKSLHVTPEDAQQQEEKESRDSKEGREAEPGASNQA